MSISPEKLIAQKKMRDFYAMTPDAPIYKKDHGFYVLDRWAAEGHIKPYIQGTDYREYRKYIAKVFNYDESATFTLYGLGECEAAFEPAFEEKILEDRGAYELVQDFAGRSVLYFKGRRDGFMPEYVDHPVKDEKTWEENVKWRLNPYSEGRLEQATANALLAKEAQDNGDTVTAFSVGGYMYLRSLIGPEDLLYTFYDDPELIHSCMQTWFELADAVCAKHQEIVSIDELSLSEDICYNGGCLISPDMMREFLFPYYQQLITNIKKRNQGRKLHVQIDTDGRAMDVIDLYKEIGMDYMSPFEVASGCDVVEIAKKHPDLLMMGGVDKRIITKGGDDLKRHIDYIMSYMRKRGGYIPACDHGVPAETPFENYVLFRSLIEEYAK